MQEKGRGTFLPWLHFLLALRCRASLHKAHRFSHFNCHHKQWSLSDPGKLVGWQSEVSRANPVLVSTDSEGCGGDGPPSYASSSLNATPAPARFRLDPGSRLSLKWLSRAGPQRGLGNSTTPSRRDKRTEKLLVWSRLIMAVVGRVGVLFTHCLKLVSRACKTVSAESFTNTRCCR